MVTKYKSTNLRFYFGVIASKNILLFTILCEANKNKEKEDQNVLENKKNKYLRYSFREDKYGKA